VISIPFEYLILMFAILLLLIIIYHLLKKGKKRKLETVVNKMEKIKEKKEKLSMLVTRRIRLLETLNDLEKSFNKKLIRKKFYDSTKVRIEKEIENIENEIITKFGNEEQLKSFDEMRKVLRDGVMRKNLYDTARKRIIKEIISKPE